MSNCSAWNFNQAINVPLLSMWSKGGKRTVDSHNSTWNRASSGTRRCCAERFTVFYMNVTVHSWRLVKQWCRRFVLGVFAISAGYSKIRKQKKTHPTVDLLFYSLLPKGHTILFCSKETLAVNDDNIIVVHRYTRYSSKFELNESVKHYRTQMYLREIIINPPVGEAE